MIKLVKEYFGLVFVVFISCALCIVLTIARFAIAEAQVYGFLLWNLFLAFIPFWLSLMVFKTKSKVKRIILLSLWLLFFPNAPYLVTDLFHYRHVPPVPQGYDMALLVSYAWTGLVLGHLSVLFIHETMIRMLHRVIAWILVFTSLLAGAFGIYLGRFLRWNSWDVIFRREMLFEDIIRIITNPYMHKLPWAVTLLTFVFLLIGYLFIRQLVNFGRRQERKNSLPLDNQK